MTDTAPDLIVSNARVTTMAPADAGSGGPDEAEAFAVRGGRIVAVGSDADIVALAGPATIVRDAGGARIIPGMTDVHNHHHYAGLGELFQLRFADTASVAEILDAVRAWAAAHPDDEWIAGGNWGSGLIGELSTVESLAALDEAAGGRKVVLADDSQHNRWASSAALAAAGIDESTADPAGGHIVRDAQGRVTGVLLEAAGALVTALETAANPIDAERAAQCSAAGVRTLHSVGVTAFLDAAASEPIMAGLKRLDDEGRLQAWVSTALVINDFIFGTQKLGQELFDVRERYRTEHHAPDWAKIFLDGVPPARTGAFLEPYLPDEAHGACHRGATTMPYEELEGWLRTCAAQGIGVKVHCTGDASVRAMLDAVEAVRRDGFANARFHVAHGQFIADDDLARFAQLGVTADISPALWFPGVIVEAIRTVRAEPQASELQPNRSLLDTGAIVAGGSDWPVAPDPSPWIGICGLVTRQDPSRVFPGELWPEQAVTLEEALAAYTIDGARAIGIDEFAGSIEPGKSADFVVLDRDPFAIDPLDLVHVRAAETWFAGERVH